MKKWDLEVLYYVFCKHQTEILNHDEQKIYNQFLKEFKQEANSTTRNLIQIFGLEAIAHEEIQRQYKIYISK